MTPETSRTAYIVDAVRSPVGRRAGGLASVNPADLAAKTIQALIKRTGVDPAEIDDVILGCFDQAGPQAGDIARTAWLVAGYPDHVPGVTIDRQCGSSQQSVQFAAQAVMSGMSDMIVAGGVQSMSIVPFQSTFYTDDTMGLPEPFVSADGWIDRFGDQEISQFRAADMIAETWGFSREAMETYAIESHERALRARAEERFASQITPIAGVEHDEGPREPNLEKMRSLRPLREGGTVTAGVASQISDAAAALLVVSEEMIERHNLTPVARIVHASARGDDPIMMLTAPISATRAALEKTSMTIDDIDLFEANEAFAPVVMAWEHDLGVDHAKVNVNGGAIALGHPIGATGARLMTTLIHEMQRTDARYGLQTMCEGGGMANVTILERC